mmetsp:Transcript_54098/g.161956  ORF Transcript_54098/g.161956 Transcript_54098/m.161956 type:complete len:82 (-) Transcript_54098:463-708(-)
MTKILRISILCPHGTYAGIIFEIVSQLKVLCLAVIFMNCPYGLMIRIHYFFSRMQYLIEILNIKKELPMDGPKPGRLHLQS